MSDRERWIVYPLLFLTLGIAMRNQFLPTRQFGAMDLKAGELTAQKILCNDLVVLQKGECNQLKSGRFQFDEALGKHIHIAGLAECMHLRSVEADFRAMQIVDPDGKPIVVAGFDKNSQAGVIQTMSVSGMPLVQIRSTDSGGAVTTIGHGGRLFVEMGNEGQNFGVFAQFPPGPPFLLTLPVRFNLKNPLPKPSQTPAPATPPQKGNPASGGQTP